MELTQKRIHSGSFYDMLCLALPITVGGQTPDLQGQHFLPLIEREGVVIMITWQDLFMFCMFVIALISLILQAIR